MIRHYLNFISSGHGRIEIDEPIGFRDADFNIKQEDKRYGRDITYAGGERELRLSSYREHCFDIVMLNYELYGSEAIVNYEIDFEEEDLSSVIGEVDFGSCKTNGVDSFVFLVIQVSDNVMYRRRFDVKANLFSSSTLDDTPIDPCVPVKMLMKAKPIVQQSQWKTPNSGGTSISVVGEGGTGANIVKHFNFANVTVESEIDASLSYIQGENPANYFGYVRAENNLKNVSIKISNLSYNISGGGNGTGYLSLKYFIGTDDELTGDTLGQGTIINEDTVNNSGDIQQNNLEFSIYVPFIPRGKKIYIWFRSLATVRFNQDTFTLSTFIKSLDIKITATSVAFNSVIPVVRLHDAMKYVTKSTSGLGIDAPRFDIGGEFYDQYITTSQLMRHLTDKPFNLSNKDITEEYLPEVNGDYEIKNNGEVFFGLYEDFYRDFQIAQFDSYRFEEYEETFNPRYTCNKVKYAYKNYASQKENEEENSFDIVHGEYEGLLPVKKGENTKEIQVGWIRDAFLWEQTRRKAIDISNTTATQDDSKIFIIDALPLPYDERTFTETAFLQHSVDNNILTLKVFESEFSWELLGIEPTYLFQITSGINIGTYRVLEVSHNDIKLQPIFLLQPLQTGERNTEFTYVVGESTTLVNRTNEGFSLIEYINNGDKYSNLRFTVKRNIYYYWRQFLSSSLLYTTNKFIKTTVYKNNPNLNTSTLIDREGRQNVLISEGAPFYAASPILGARIYNATIIMTLPEFIDMQESLRINRGWIGIYDARRNPIKGYIKEAQWIPLSSENNDVYELLGACAVTLEEKYVPYTMTIVNNETGGITINNEITPSGFSWTIDELGYLKVFNESGKLLHSPTLFNKVQINNSETANSPTQLAEWMQSLLLG